LPNEKLLHALRLDYQKYECDRVLDVLNDNVLDEEDIETLRTHKMQVYKDCKKAMFHGADILDYVGKGGGFVAGIGYSVVHRMNGLVGRLAWRAADAVAKTVAPKIISPTNVAAKAYVAAKIVSPEGAWMAALWAARKVGCRDPYELGKHAKAGILQGGGTEAEGWMAVTCAVGPVGVDVLQGDYLGAMKQFEGRARELAGLDPPKASEVPLNATFVANTCRDACKDEFNVARGTTEKAMNGGLVGADALNKHFGLEEMKEQSLREEGEQLYELWCCGRSSKASANEGGIDGMLSGLQRTMGAVVGGKVQNGEVYLSRSAPFYLRHAENRPSEMVAEVAGGETKERKE
jgi:hypothetical protein